MHYIISALLQPFRCFQTSHPLLYLNLTPDQEDNDLGIIFPLQKIIISLSSKGQILTTRKVMRKTKY